jgi:two-component system chemotaxis response regulator CheB
MNEKVRVLVVDDSAFSRQTIKKMLESDPAIEVLAVAVDGMDAMSKTMRLSPDLITLDLEMPEMDGFSFLRWVMKEKPTPVIMVSSHSDAQTVFRALELGAVDFIAKPTKRASAEFHSLEKDLLMKARGVKGLNLEILSRNLKLIDSVRASAEAPAPAVSRVDCVAVGTSTGGPPALQIVLSKMPRDFPSGLVITQHMPRGFTRSFAERLDKVSRLRVKEAREGDAVERGTALVCPGGSHMLFRREAGGVRVALREGDAGDKYVPSVDLMMHSAYDCFGSRMMGVVLTGMGSDGCEAMVRMHRGGCHTIAESQETSVVFGMPQEVISAGAADCVVGIQNVASEIIRYVMGERRG